MAACRKKDDASCKEKNMNVGSTCGQWRCYHGWERSCVPTKVSQTSRSEVQGVERDYNVYRRCTQVYRCFFSFSSTQLIIVYKPIEVGIIGRVHVSVLDKGGLE